LMAQKSKNLSSHDLCIITLSTEKRWKVFFRKHIDYHLSPAVDFS
jgi:hypothetical protein